MTTNEARNFSLYGLPRNELIRLLQKRMGYFFTKLFIIIGLWVTLALLVLVTPFILSKIILWCVLGFVMNGLIQMIHDAWHGNLFNKKWQNRFFGHIMSLIFPIMYEPARHGHMLHHRYNRTAKDPDAYNAGKRSFVLVLLYYIVILLGLPLAIIHFNILYPIQYYTKPQLVKHFVKFSIFVSYYLVIIFLMMHWNLSKIAIQCWIIPFLFTSPWNGFKSVADHYANDWNGNKFRIATTVYSNKIITYLWNGLNYHLDHHLFPGVPGYNLPRVHQFIKATLKQHNAPIFKSYFRVWKQAWLSGPTFVDDDVKFLSLNKKAE